MSFEDKVDEKFNERFPKDEEMNDLNEGQYFSVALQIFIFIGFACFLFTLTLSPALFLIILCLIVCSLPFLLMWGSSIFYNVMRAILKKQVDEKLKNQPDQPKEVDDSDKFSLEE